MSLVQSNAEHGQKLNVNSLVSRAGSAVSCDLAGEAVILNLQSGIYFGVNNVGARIWELIENPSSIQQILDVLMGEYDVEATQCKSAVLSFVQQMSARQLIELA